MNKNKVLLASAVAGMAILTALTASCTTGDLRHASSFEQVREGFISPESSHGVDCWWWWLNGNVTEEAIDSELKAMKEKGFYGAMIFDAGGHNQRSNKDIPAGPLFGSPEWIRLFAHALDVADSLGLEIGFNIQSGWNLGSPETTPEDAAKTLAYSEVFVEGGTASVLLPKPSAMLDYYRDIAVLAFPIDENRISDEPVRHLSYKLGNHELGGSAPDCRFLLDNEKDDKQKAVKAPYLVNVEDVQDITACMRPDGSLDWTVPDGRWAVLRIGYTLTGSRISTSSRDWQGLVLDYMSADAFDRYWASVVKPILDAVPQHVGKTLKFMETDSWECGGMNWSPGFESYFKELHGYDLVRYLPIAAGYVVDDIKTSNAFLADFRKAIAKAVSANHYGRFSEYAHALGMGIQPESAGPHAGPLDGLDNYSHNDIMMSEFWAPSPHRRTDRDRFFVKQASSAAHIFGKKIVGAESFTTIGPHWNDELWSGQKPAFDHEVCSGLNRVYFHTFTSSPSSAGLPGQEYFAGTHFNSRLTWWEQSTPFIEYLERIQTVAQEAEFVADVLHYYGDHVPNVYPYKETNDPHVLPGYDYDVTNEDVLLRLEVSRDGKIRVPGGLEYSVLTLPDHRVLSLAALRKVSRLVKAGATVVGEKPVDCVSLAGGAKGRKEFKKLVDKVWGPGDSEQNPSVRKYGKGHVVSGCSAREYFQSCGHEADFEVVGMDWYKTLDYIHYRLDGRDFYFVSNQTGDAVEADCMFRVAGKSPEFWDALDGTIRKVGTYRQEEGRTRIPIVLGPYSSIFVVFDGAIGQEAAGSDPNYASYEEVVAVEGPWNVYFDPERGGPGSVVFDELSDWTLNPDDGIKHYSGTAEYSSRFDMAAMPSSGERIFMELGSVKDVGIASVSVNGIDCGITWTWPFRVDITDALKDGENLLKVDVVNSWYNRVAGDEIHPEARKYTSTNIVLAHDFLGRPSEIKLSPSGLIGPVRVLSAR